MRTRSFVPEIQALRAVAVLLVVLYHAGVVFPGGYIGVDVFFVISGYLITNLLLRELGRSERIRFGHFYARRIRRLLPAAAVVLLATTVVAWQTYSPLDFKQYTTSAIATAAYVSNFWFAHLATDYLAADAHTNAVLHTWSLSVEEQFYLAWPLLMLLLYRLGSARGQRRVLLLGLGAVSAISFAASLYLTASNQPLAFFGSPTRAWEFGVGGLLAIAGLPSRWRASPPSTVRTALSAAGLALIVVAGLRYTNATPFPGTAATLPVLGTALVIATCTGTPSSRLTRWMHWRPVQYVGDISYSLYLWHWPILIFLDQQEDLARGASLAIYFASSFLLAGATYVAVENPARFHPRLVGHVLASFALAAAATAATAGTAWVLRGMAQAELATPEQRRYRRASTDIPKVYRDGCHLDYRDTEPRECAYGDVDSSRVIVLFGDSHAAQWFPALEEIASREGYRLVSMTKSRCPSMSVEPFARRLRRAYTECTEWRERAFAQIAALQPEFVVLSNSSNNALGEGDGDGDWEVDRETWAQAAAETYQRLEAMGAPVVLIRDTPWPGLHVPSCLSRATWRELPAGEQCRFSVASDAREAVYEIERSQLERLGAGVAVDMTEAICPGGTDCPVERGGIVLFHDSHHLTTRFSRSLADDLREKIGDPGHDGGGPTPARLPRPPATPRG